MLDVVAACVRREIIRDGKIRNLILLQQRKANLEFPGHWCCPGGKVEPNETHLEAVVREMMEEHKLPIYVTSNKPLISLEFQPPLVRKAARITIYDARVVGDVNYSEEYAENMTRSDYQDVWEVGHAAQIADGVIGLGWFTLEEAYSLRGTPSLFPLLERLTVLNAA